MTNDDNFVSANRPVINTRDPSERPLLKIKRLRQLPGPPVFQGVFTTAECKDNTAQTQFVSFGSGCYLSDCLRVKSSKHRLKYFLLWPGK